MKEMVKVFSITLCICLAIPTIVIITAWWAGHLQHWLIP